MVNEPTNNKLGTVELGNIDSLEGMDAAPIDLMSDYWTPVNKGEKKRVIFDRIDITTVPDQVTGEALEMDCAFFFIKDGEQIKRIRNGSKRLVGALHNIQHGTPLEIIYQGKVRNKTNGNQSDNWSIIPLVVNVAK